jgi:hypothetical protein
MQEQLSHEEEKVSHQDDDDEEKKVQVLIKDTIIFEILYVNNPHRCVIIFRFPFRGQMIPLAITDLIDHIGEMLSQSSNSGVFILYITTHQIGIN